MYTITSSKAFHRIWSEYSSNGSKFFRTVPANKNGSWGMMEILERKSWSPNSCISTSSTMIRPSFNDNLNSAPINDDLPAPVLPTIPTFWLRKKKKTYKRETKVVKKKYYFLLGFNVKVQIFQNVRCIRTVP